MRRPRFSIAGIMGLTALIALDCMATRAVFQVNDLRVGNLYFWALPFLNVLLVGLAVLRGRWRRGEPVAFLVGFEAAGVGALLASVAANFAFPRTGDAALFVIGNFLRPLAEAIPPVGIVLAFACGVTILSLPQLLVAGLGGLLHRRYRARIERRDRTGAAD